MKTTRVLNVYRRDFQLYMLLMFQRTSITIAHREIRNRLAVALCIPEVLSSLHVLIRTFAQLKTPECPEPQMGYLRLMQKLFPDETRLFGNDTPLRPTDIVHVWQQFLKFLDQQERNLLPSSHEDLLQDLVSWMIENNRASIMPMWTDDVFQLIECKLCLLGKQQQEVIRKRFGIGCPPKTLRRAAIEMRLTFERVRQVEVSALKLLANPSGNLIQLIQPIGNLLVQQMQVHKDLLGNDGNKPTKGKHPKGLLIRDDGTMKRPEAVIEHEISKSLIPMEVLLLPVHELQLTKRQQNILENYQTGLFPNRRASPIHFLGDLIQCPVQEFLKQKNCGANSFEVIKQKLAQQNLSFGTILDPETKRTFSQERAQLLSRPSL